MRIFHGKCGNRNADFRVGKDGGELSLEQQQCMFDLYSERIEVYLDDGQGEGWLNGQCHIPILAEELRSR